MKQRNKKIGSFYVRMDECLGQGSFASIYKAYKDRTYKQCYACKVIGKQEIENLLKTNHKYFINRVQQQYSALIHLKHPHIVEFYDIEQTANNLYLFFQYCESDLEKYIKQHFFERNESQVYQFSRQIISACHYFTSKYFVHRDIKPANILLKNKQIKIADFGLATKIEDVEKIVTFAGTPQYMAPQILKGVKMKDVGKCDVWSVGVTIFQLCTGQLPYGITKKDFSEKRILDLINNKFEIKIEKHPILQDLVRKMLVVQPSQRISFQDAYEMVNKEQFGPN